MFVKSIKNIPLFFVPVLFFSIVLLSAFNAEKPSYTQCLKASIQIDSLTDSIEVIDTVATYDPNDYSEKLVFIKRKIPRVTPKESTGFSIEDIVFTGKTMAKKDTFATYNPATKEQTLMITSYDMPIELEEPMKGMNPKETTKLKIKYATNKKTETKIVKRKK